MRVLYLHRTQGRGVEAVHIRGMADAMREAGHEVRVVGPPDTDPYATAAPASAPGPAARFARRAPELLFELAEIAYDRRLAARLAEQGRTFKPDLLYERYAFFGRAGGGFARRRGIPQVLEVNYTCADPLVRRRSGLMMPLSRRAEAGSFRAATLLAPVSSRLEARILHHGIGGEKVLVTPNAVSRSWWEAAAAVTPRPLDALPAGEPVVGFVGGFFPWHGVDRLVEAFRRCRELGLPGSLLLVGDGPERQAIEAQLAAAGLGDRALLPGAVDHAELSAWIAAMSICVMPHSNDYGSPMKIFEYMGQGRAVLAPDLPPLRDVIEDGRSGRLFAAASTGDPVEPLRVGLAELLADAPLRKALAAAGRARVGERHTWRENWRRIASVLDRAEEAAPSADEEPVLSGNGRS